jgi:hypothetical protein
MGATSDNAGTKMPIWLILLVALLAIGAGVGIGAGVWSGGTSLTILRSDITGKGTDLFVVDAQSATSVRQGSHAWRIELVQPDVLWFEDTPGRGSGVIPIAPFVSTWSGRFARSAPYGAVVAPAGPAGHNPTAVKISKPTYDAAAHVASFLITPDAGESTADATWLSSLSAKDGRVVLFIDNALPFPTTLQNCLATASDQPAIDRCNQIQQCVETSGTGELALQKCLETIENGYLGDLSNFEELPNPAYFNYQAPPGTKNGQG